MIASGAKEDELRAIMRSIRQLVALLAQSARSVERRTGITNAQLFVLQQLAESGPLSINDIAALALTHQSAASVVVSRLEREGMVLRARSAEDARRAEVTLTPQGRRLVRTAPPPATTRLLEALRSLPVGDRHRLGVSLVRLSTVLGIGEAEPMMLFEAKALTRAAASGTRVKARKRRRVE